MAILLSRNNTARTLLMLLLLFSCVGCDQVIKELARTYLAFQPPLSCCHDVVRLHYVENAGAFLGLGWNLPEEMRIVLFQMAVGIGLLALFVVLLRSQNQPHGFLIAWTLILSGGLGNVLDRLLHHGRVTDFMNLGVGPCAPASSTSRTSVLRSVCCGCCSPSGNRIHRARSRNKMGTARAASLSATLALWLALAVGCDGNRATGPAFEDLIHPGPETALVYFYRPPGRDGDQAPDWVYAFDRIIRLDDGGYSFHTVPPGRYLIALRSQTDPKADWYDLAGGRAVFLKWDRVKGKSQPDLIPVEERRALEELPRCRLMQQDPAGRP